MVVWGGHGLLAHLIALIDLRPFLRSSPLSHRSARPQFNSTPITLILVCPSSSSVGVNVVGFDRIQPPLILQSSLTFHSFFLESHPLPDRDPTASPLLRNGNPHQIQQASSFTYDFCFIKFTGFISAIHLESSRSLARSDVFEQDLFILHSSPERIRYRSPLLTTSWRLPITSITTRHLSPRILRVF